MNMQTITLFVNRSYAIYVPRDDFHSSSLPQTQSPRQKIGKLHWILGAGDFVNEPYTSKVNEQN
jgi:hypothetical protein